MKYLLKSPNLNGSILLTYDTNDNLANAEINAELTENQRVYLATRFPLNRAMLMEVVYKTSFTMTEVSDDLSFANFWNRYAHKHGDKKKAEKLWNLLSDADKAAALAYIPTYLHYLSVRQNMEQAHATTWLNQRRWETN